MTRKLEELFDLPEGESMSEDRTESEDHTPQETKPELPVEVTNAIDKINEALPAVRGLDAGDSEMDELASKASKTFDDLMDLGMNVDSRYAHEIFSVASQMLNHAITAKNAKLNKKLKMIELQLRKAKLDQDSAKHETPDEGFVSAEGTVLDRNELLNRVLGKNASDDTN